MLERSKTRNSGLRIHTQGFMTALAAGIHSNAEWVTPDMITVGGLVGVAVTAGWAIKLNEKRLEENVYQRIAAAVVYTAFCVSDGVDGALARYKQSLNPLRESSWYGGLIDIASDRLQELVMALSRAITAFKNGNIIGEHLAYGAALTRPIPSAVRAFGEGFLDQTSAELGNNLIEAGGNRFISAVSAGFSTFASEFKGIPIQAGLDELQIITNSASAVGRARGFFDGRPPAGLSEQERREARYRLAVVGAIEGVAGISVYQTRKILRAA